MKKILILLSVILFSFAITSCKDDEKIDDNLYDIMNPSIALKYVNLNDDEITPNIKHSFDTIKSAFMVDATLDGKPFVPRLTFELGNSTIGVTDQRYCPNGIVIYFDNYNHSDASKIAEQTGLDYVNGNIKMHLAIPDLSDKTDTIEIKYHYSLDDHYRAVQYDEVILNGHQTYLHTVLLDGSITADTAIKTFFGVGALVIKSNVSPKQ